MQAVKRMLPGGPLSRRQMTHLRVYAGRRASRMMRRTRTVLDVKSMNKKNTRSA